jgi:hypothetical protein
MVETDNDRCTTYLKPEDVCWMVLEVWCRSLSHAKRRTFEIPYRMAKCGHEDHLATPVTSSVVGEVRGMWNCSLVFRPMVCARLAGRTESYVRTPSIATSGQYQLPVSRQACRDVSGLGQKPNEAATHGNVGGSRTVLKAAEPQQNENFQGLAQHESFGRRTLESWRKAEKQWDPCFCCTVDIRCRRQGRTHMRQAYQCR